MTDNKKIIVSAFAAFVISGIGGYYFKDWAEKPVPEISAVSLGFQGDIIKLSERLVRATDEVVWGPTLQPYISFSSLLEYEKGLNEAEQQITRAKTIVDDWLKGHPQAEMDRQLRQSEILSVPMAIDVVIMSSIEGELRRRQIKLPPANLDEIKRYDEKFPLFNSTAGETIVHFGSRSLTFPIHGEYGDREHLIIQVLAEGLARGHGKTIWWIHNLFAQQTADELNKIAAARKLAQQELIEQSHLSTTLAILNDGKQPVVFQPYFKGLVQLGDSKRQFLFQVSSVSEHNLSKDRSSVEQTLLDVLVGSSQDEARGTPVAAQYFLPGSKDIQYINVNPGASLTVKMVSNQSIGMDGADFLKFFDIGVLKFQIVGVTSKSQAVSSELLEFGRKISRERLSTLEASAKRTFE